MLLHDQKSISRSNLEQEEAWIQAWSDLYELSGGISVSDYLTPSGQSLTKEQALAWLQDSAYAGMSVSVELAEMQGMSVIRLWRAKV